MIPSRFTKCLGSGVPNTKADLRRRKTRPPLNGEGSVDGKHRHRGGAETERLLRDILTAVLAQLTSLVLTALLAQVWNMLASQRLFFVFGIVAGLARVVAGPAAGHLVKWCSRMRLRLRATYLISALPKALGGANFLATVAIPSLVAAVISSFLSAESNTHSIDEDDAWGFAISDTMVESLVAAAFLGSAAYEAACLAKLSCLEWDALSTTLHSSPRHRQTVAQISKTVTFGHERVWLVFTFLTLLKFVAAGNFLLVLAAVAELHAASGPLVPLWPDANWVVGATPTRG